MATWRNSRGPCNGIHELDALDSAWCRFSLLIILVEFIFFLSPTPGGQFAALNIVWDDEGRVRHACDVAGQFSNPNSAICMTPGLPGGIR